MRTIGLLAMSMFAMGAYAPDFPAVEPVSRPSPRARRLCRAPGGAGVGGGRLKVTQRYRGKRGTSADDDDRRAVAEAKRARRRARRQREAE